MLYNKLLGNKLSISIFEIKPIEYIYHISFISSLPLIFLESIFYGIKDNRIEITFNYKMFLNFFVEQTKKCGCYLIAE